MTVNIMYSALSSSMRALQSQDTFHPRHVLHPTSSQTLLTQLSYKPQLNNSHSHVKSSRPQLLNQPACCVALLRCKDLSFVFILISDSQTLSHLGLRLCHCFQLLGILFRLPCFAATSISQSAVDWSTGTISGPETQGKVYRISLPSGVFRAIAGIRSGQLYSMDYQRL